MRATRALRFGLVVGGLVLLQGSAVLLYRAVESRRNEGSPESFAYERLAEARPAPDLELVAPDGSRSRLTDRRGKLVLLHFWATWCPPCRAELPFLLSLGEELAREGPFELLAVTTDEDWRVVRDFLGREPPPSVQMDRGRGHASYAVTMLPDTYVVTPDGRITARLAGARDWSSRQAREFLRSEMARSRSSNETRP